MTGSDDIPHLVVQNEEGRYSLWPEARPLPWGWKAEGPPGSRAECLARIEELWTDLRPLGDQQ